MSAILTVGYANRSIEDVIKLLKRERVQYLIDVRSSPSSRFKPEFSREHLKHVIQRAGIRYVFMGDALGGRPSDPSCYENGHVIYSRVEQKTYFRRGIDRLIQAHANGFRISLLCSESRPEHCHRSKLIGVSLTKKGAMVIHLGPQGEHMTQGQIIARLMPQQSDLFGDELYSRKAYRTPAGRSKSDKISR